jgi:23S rRNA (adenine2503-C2)-methyltransferase
MTNLPLELRGTLKSTFELNSLTIEQILTIKNSTTKKILYRLTDGNVIETALMRYKYGYSVCVSTQVGCKMGCVFCVSGMNGFVRNLTTSEILEQVILSQQVVGERIGHVVIMGIGEPLDNLKNVVKFIELVSHPAGINIGQRNITISTVGLVDEIYVLMKLKLQVTLSISLHAPEDELRCSLVPVNKKWNIAQLIEACKEYFKVTHRRISFEYIMLEGINDSLGHATKLARLLLRLHVHINLIPANFSGRKEFKSSNWQTIEKFKRKLEDSDVPTTIRRTMGTDIKAGCGQMRHATQKKDSSLERE